MLIMMIKNYTGVQQTKHTSVESVQKQSIQVYKVYNNKA